MLRSVVVNNALLAFSLSLVCALVSISHVSASEVQSATDVNATVCNGSSLAITSPLSDSSVTNQSVTIEGTVSGISQVETYIDGGYNSTEALPANAATFQVTVSVPVGTHTLEVIGTNPCGTDSISDQVVITVSQSTPPTEGQDIPTTVDPRPTQGGGGGVIVVETPPSGSANEPIKDSVGALPGLDLVPGLIKKGLDVMDLQTVASDGWLRGAVRMLLVVLGIILLSFGSSLSRMLARVTGQDNLRSISFGGDIGIRFIGLILFIVGLSL